MTTIRNIVLCRSKGNIFVAWLIRLPLAIASLLLFPIIAFTMACIYNLGDVILGQSLAISFPPDATHVPASYFPKHRYSEYWHFLVLMVFASIFGGIHCAGWNFPFLTYAEQKLWRIASLAVTIIPSVLILIVTICLLESPTDVADAFRGGIAPLILTLIYVSSRLILLGQAIALLRHQPPTAFITVGWTQFYPHIF